VGVDVRFRRVGLAGVETLWLRREGSGLRVERPLGRVGLLDRYRGAEVDGSAVDKVVVLACGSDADARREVCGLLGGNEVTMTVPGRRDRAVLAPSDSGIWRGDRAARVHGWNRGDDVTRERACGDGIGRSSLLRRRGNRPGIC
jgi:hypothetical protein